MERVPQSIAERVLLKCYLSVDHSTPATGLDPAVTISKNGAAFANPAAGATVATEIGSGWYYVDIAIADRDTLGPFITKATHADMDDSEVTCVVADLKVDLTTLAISNIHTEMESVLSSSMITFTRSSGTIAANGTEQTVYENAAPTANWIPDNLYIDLTNMALGDTIDIKVYCIIKVGGSYVLFDSQNYTGAQSVDGITIKGVPNRYGYKVTLQQTAGTNRNYDYENYILG
jgi:hypothetical protein